LSIFPFEKNWYGERAPQLRVEFVGHPMVDRSQKSEVRNQKPDKTPVVLLLPGSRGSELQRHLPILFQAAWKIVQTKAVRYICVLPNESLAALAKPLALKNGWPDMIFQIGNLPDALAQADLAIASTGTVTMECAFFGVPTVTLYKTSWFNYEIAKRIVTVKWATMPNILANEEVFPEFIQNAATPEAISLAALELLQNESRRAKIKSQLAKIVSSLGEPGAARSAAAAILSLLD
jgi:lipid-A-disaccharide synthase